MVMAGERTVSWWRGALWFLAAAMAVMIVVACGLVPPAAAAPDLHLQLYYVFSAPTEFYLVPVDVSVPDPSGELAASPERRAVKALEMLIQGPPPGSPLWCSIPPATRVLGCRIQDGTAEVDFSGDILRCNVGARTESLLLSSLVATVGQATGAERVRFLVEGRPVESLGGHVDVTGPLPVRGSLEHALFRAPADLRGHWSEGPATALFLAGVLHGYPEGDFRPEQPVTRNEFFKMVVLVGGLAPLDTATATFTDVPVGHWAHPYVERAVAGRILVPSDYGARLNGDGYITRREVAVAVVRARGLEDEAERLRGSELPYTDTDTQPDWARGYLAVAYREGLMIGDPEGTFRPASPLDRGEAAAVTARLGRMGGPSIYLAYPPEGAAAGDRVLALGSARVFEATVRARLRVGGVEVASNCATATEGGPGWGVFGLMLPRPAGLTEAPLLEVFWESPEDGRELDVVVRRLR